MSRLLTDSWEQDRHGSLKRWERGAQRAAWSRRAQDAGAAPWPCPWRATSEAADGAPILRPAHILALFTGELAVVRFVSGNVAVGNVAFGGATSGGATGDLEGGTGSASRVPGDGLRVLRGALPWETWSALALNAWRHAAPVPEPFRPRRRIPPIWLDQALGWSPADQRLFLDKLRASGALPPLRPVTAEAVAPWLRWEEMRARLMDFGS